MGMGVPEPTEVLQPGDGSCDSVTEYRSGQAEPSIDIEIPQPGYGPGDSVTGYQSGQAEPLLVLEVPQPGDGSGDSLPGYPPGQTEDSDAVSSGLLAEGKQPTAPELGEGISQPSPESGTESHEIYDQTEVASKYSENLAGAFKDAFLELGRAPDLQWQAGVIVGMLHVIVGRPDLAPALLAEVEDLMNELASRSGSGGSSGASRSKVSSEEDLPHTHLDVDVASDEDSAEYFGGILSKLITKKVPSVVLKMIAHLSTPKQWQLSFELGANMFIFSTKGTVAITFGE